MYGSYGYGSDGYYGGDDDSTEVSPVIVTLPQPTEVSPVYVSPPSSEPNYYFFDFGGYDPGYYQPINYAPGGGGAPAPAPGSQPLTPEQREKVTKGLDKIAKVLDAAAKAMPEGPKRDAVEALAHQLDHIKLEIEVGGVLSQQTLQGKIADGIKLAVSEVGSATAGWLSGTLAAAILEAADWEGALVTFAANLVVGVAIGAMVDYDIEHMGVDAFSNWAAGKIVNLMSSTPAPASSDVYYHDPLVGSAILIDPGVLVAASGGGGGGGYGYGYGGGGGYGTGSGSGSGGYG